jgi:hypothetical protein
MAELRILCNLLRCWTALDSEEVVVVMIGKAGESSSSSLLNNACRMLLVTFIAWVLVLCVSGGDFMVVVGEGFSYWSLRCGLRK